MEGRRARLRAKLSSEIKAAALSELRRVGPASLSLREVAKCAGISPSGMYRYVDGRDGLLELLITDGFESYGAAIEAAIEAAGERSVAQLEALAHSYLQWARENPAQFALILGSPVPGFEAQPDGPTLPAVQRFARPIVALYARASRRPEDDAADDSEWVDVRQFGPGLGYVPRSVLDAMLRSWGRIHGLVALSIFGHLSWSNTSVDELLRAEVAAIAVDFIEG